MIRSPLPRQSGEERRVAIIQVAVEEFAQRGYAGGSTETIARRIGISQPYIFRLFGTKKELFLAALDAVCVRLQEIFTAVARSTEDATGEARLAAMGQAYAGLRSHRHELLLLFQAIGASGDEEIRVAVRQRYWALFQEIQRLSGVSSEEMQNFFADGLLLTASTLLDLPELIAHESR